MATNVTIMSRERVIDPSAEGGHKEIVNYGIRDAAALPEVLTLYPGTGNGSSALDLTTGDFYVFLDGWIKMGEE